MAEKFSHKNCDHPSTPAARAICRKNQAALASGPGAKTNSTQKQVGLTKLYRENLLELAGTTVSQIRDKLGLSEADLADIDLWFEREMPDLIKVIERNHKKAGLLTVSYLRQHAALGGFNAGDIVVAGIIREQLEKSLAVTGPGAFKKHIASGGTEEEALKVMQTTLPGASERLAMQGARETLTDAVENLESPTLGYTRRTSGPACTYCQGLSHDPVYVGSKDVKTFHAHDHCTCTGEPFYLNDDRIAVNRLSEADLFRETFEELDKKSIQELWDIPSLMINHDDTDFNLYAYEGHAINRYLRWGAYDDEGKWTGDEQLRMLMDTLTDEMDDSLDDLIYRLYHGIQEAPPLQEDMIAWRGITRGKSVFGKERWEGNLEGLTWYDEGFTSTTVDATYADSWAGGMTFADEGLAARVAEEPVLMNLLIRKGTRLVSLDSELKGQYEVLLQRGEATQFKIIKDHKWDKDRGIRIIDVEVTFGGKK